MGAAAALQAEVGAPVVEQVEFDVAAAPVELEGAFALAVSGVFALPDDGQVGGKPAFANGTGEGGACRKVGGLVVVVEKTADAARFAAMRQVEVAVAPGFVARVEIGTEGDAGIMGGAVPGAAVVIKRVIRGEVDAATEPPGADALAVVCGEKADVGMAGRDVGVARVDDQRQAVRGVGAICEFGAFFRRRRRQLVASDVRDVDAPLLEDGAILQHHRQPVPAQAGLVTLPGVAAEGAAVCRGQGGGDALLQVVKVGSEGADVGGSRFHGGSVYRLAVHSLTAKAMKRSPTRVMPTAARARERAKTAVRRMPAKARMFR